MLGISVPIHAEPTSAQTTILSIRPYTQSTAAGVVFVQVAQSNLCSTDTFLIDLASGGSKQAVAAAMLALATGARVAIEISGACAGVYTNVQSIYIYKS